MGQATGHAALLQRAIQSTAPSAGFSNVLQGSRRGHATSNRKGESKRRGMENGKQNSSGDDWHDKSEVFGEQRGGEDEEGAQGELVGEHGRDGGEERRNDGNHKQSREGSGSLFDLEVHQRKQTGRLRAGSTDRDIYENRRRENGSSMLDSASARLVLRKGSFAKKYRQTQRSITSEAIFTRKFPAERQSSRRRSETLRENERGAPPRAGHGMGEFQHGIRFRDHPKRKQRHFHGGEIKHGLDQRILRSQAHERRAVHVRGRNGNRGSRENKEKQSAMLHVCQRHRK